MNILLYMTLFLIGIIVGNFWQRVIYRIPRDIGITNGVGTNNLIKMGAALVTSPKEILQEMGIIYDEIEESESIENETNKKEENQIDDEYKEIYNLISYIPKSINYISAKSGLNISDINQKLTILELEGYIKSLPGNNYVRC